MDSVSTTSHYAQDIPLSCGMPRSGLLSPDRKQYAQPILHDNDQSTSERVFDAVQGTPQYHRDPPEVGTSASVHDWCNAINCDLCAARALAHAFHVGNIQGDLNTPRYLGQQTFDTNRQNNTLFGPSIAYDQSDQTIPGSELFPIFHRASDWSNSTSSHLTDQHSAHSSIVIRQGDPIPPISGSSHHPPLSSWLFPQEPPRNCGDANRTKSMNFISTSPLFENIPGSTSSMNMQLSPYGDHSGHFCSPHGYIPYPRSAAAASVADNSARTSPSCPRFGGARKKTYPVGYEPDIGKLQDRCRLSGAEDTAVDMLPAIFLAGITLEALTRHRTSTEIETAQFGSGGGPVYIALLEQVMKAEGEGSVIAYRCRLCPNGGDAFAWKKPRDALRHLRRNHLGLGDCCPRCGKRAYTNGEMKRHQCRPTASEASDRLEGGIGR